jgi:hypothetical protein
MEEWERIIEQDNRRGVLAGQDKDGRPMVPVTYRPAGDKPKRWTKANDKKVAARAGLQGPIASGYDDNLTSAEYRRLAGQPLAPRGLNSRSIKNLLTQHGRDGGGWFAEGAWFDVVSRKGVQFLMAHFTVATCGRGHRTKLPCGRSTACGRGVRSSASRRPSAGGVTS